MSSPSCLGRHAVLLRFPWTSHLRESSTEDVGSGARLAIPVGLAGSALACFGGLYRARNLGYTASLSVEVHIYEYIFIIGQRLRCPWRRKTWERNLALYQSIRPAPPRFLFSSSFSTSTSTFHAHRSLFTSAQPSHQSGTTILPQPTQSFRHLPIQCQVQVSSHDSQKSYCIALNIFNHSYYHQSPTPSKEHRSIQQNFKEALFPFQHT